MRKIEVLSPELQRLIGFAKPTAAQIVDLNGDKAGKLYIFSFILQKPCNPVPTASNQLVCKKLLGAMFDVNPALSMQIAIYALRAGKY